MTDSIVCQPLHGYLCLALHALRLDRNGTPIFPPWCPECGRVLVGNVDFAKRAWRIARALHEERGTK